MPRKDTQYHEDFKPSQKAAAILQGKIWPTTINKLLYSKIIW